MKIPPTTVTHNVGTCPACRDYLWAEVHVEVNVSPPTMTRDGAVIVNASPTLVGMTVAHSCWYENGERQTLNTGQLGDLGDIAEAQRDAVRFAANIFRDMSMERLDRHEVIDLLDIRAESYRARDEEPTP